MRSTLHLFCVLLTLLLAPACLVRASGPFDKYYHRVALRKYRQAHTEFEMTPPTTYNAENFERQNGAMRDRWLERARSNNVMFIGKPPLPLVPKPRYFSSVIRPDGPNDQLAHDMKLRYVNGPNSVLEYDALILWKHASGKTTPLKVDIVRNLDAHYPTGMLLVDAIGTTSFQVRPLWPRTLTRITSNLAW
ncbi:conserved hypothetical Ustilaginaceae-specific protein [Sporisorium reilianum SRZ2]|uniref:Conserved hypothetical Ustilaginaceae-specific protein n=1 Tax=Sporisorium reilianum (strain SRZ2) TaxID=999809 RepID=E6ZZW7_SPORE|nr:conserved hypothetical Ustilaginaceae-specific protein [Sporisorium reilianum SRZ2]